MFNYKERRKKIEEKDLLHKQAEASYAHLVGYFCDKDAHIKIPRFTRRDDIPEEISPFVHFYMNDRRNNIKINDTSYYSLLCLFEAYNQAIEHSKNKKTSNNESSGYVLISLNYNNYVRTGKTAEQITNTFFLELRNDYGLNYDDMVNFIKDIEKLPQFRVVKGRKGKNSRVSTRIYYLGFENDPTFTRFKKTKTLVNYRKYKRYIRYLSLQTVLSHIGEYGYKTLSWAIRQNKETVRFYLKDKNDSAKKSYKAYIENENISREEKKYCLEKAKQYEEHSIDFMKYRGKYDFLEETFGINLLKPFRVYRGYKIGGRAYGLLTSMKRDKRQTLCDNFNLKEIDIISAQPRIALFLDDKQEIAKREDAYRLVFEEFRKTNPYFNSEDDFYSLFRGINKLAYNTATNVFLERTVSNHIKNAFAELGLCYNIDYPRRKKIEGRRCYHNYFREVYNPKEFVENYIKNNSEHLIKKGISKEVIPFKAEYELSKFKKGKPDYLSEEYGPYRYFMSKEATKKTLLLENSGLSERLKRIFRNHYKTDKKMNKLVDDITKALYKVNSKKAFYKARGRLENIESNAMFSVACENRNVIFGVHDGLYVLDDGKTQEIHDEFHDKFDNEILRYHLGIDSVNYEKSFKDWDTNPIPHKERDIASPICSQYTINLINSYNPSPKIRVKKIDSLKNSILHILDKFNIKDVSISSYKEYRDILKRITRLYFIFRSKKNRIDFEKHIYIFLRYIYIIHGKMDFYTSFIPKRVRSRGDPPILNKTVYNLN